MQRSVHMVKIQKWKLRKKMNKFEIIEYDVRYMYTKSKH